MTETLYLSRVRLRRSASVGALLPLLLGDGGSDNGQSQHPGHHLIWSLFAAEPAMPRNFLWREMEQDGAFLILSARPPVDRHALFDIDEPKPFTPALVPGDQLHFSLRANPVIRRRDSERSRSVKHDVVMDALRSCPAGERAEHRIAAIHEQGLAWLERQANKAGFAIRPGDVRIEGYRQHRVRRKKLAAMAFSTLDFDGALEVQDPSAFLSGIGHGFGAAKAYGCGLMLVRRI